MSTNDHITLAMVVYGVTFGKITLNLCLVSLKTERSYPLPDVSLIQPNMQLILHFILCTLPFFHNNYVNSQTHSNLEVVYTMQFSKRNLSVGIRVGTDPHAGVPFACHTRGLTEVVPRKNRQTEGVRFYSRCDTMHI